MGADRALDDGFASFAFSLGFAHEVERQLAGERPGPGNETRTLQKRPPIHCRSRSSGKAAETWTSCAGAFRDAVLRFGEQHGPSSSY
jgi:hypothetical protein